MENPPHTTQPAVACPRYQSSFPHYPVSLTPEVEIHPYGRALLPEVVEISGGRELVAGVAHGPQLVPFRYPTSPDTDRLPSVRDLLPPHIVDILPSRLL